jgi:hypothetical protein
MGVDVSFYFVETLSGHSSFSAALFRHSVGELAATSIAKGYEKSTALWQKLKNSIFQDFPTLTF